MLQNVRILIYCIIFVTNLRTLTTIQTMIETNTIGNKISLLREKLGYTQFAIAEFLNIKREMLSYYETGSREIPIDILEKLSVLYGVDLECLIESDKKIDAACLAFAFRADNIENNDLHAIAHFKEIVMNYLKMDSYSEPQNDRTY